MKNLKNISVEKMKSLLEFEVARYRTLAELENDFQEKILAQAKALGVAIALTRLLEEVEAEND
jgi:hypothetical protein